MKISVLGIGILGVRYWGMQKGNLFALLPDPVDADACLERAGFTSFADSDDAWDRDFERVVSDLLQALRRRWEEPEVVAPPRSTRRPWTERLRAFFGKHHDDDILNPGGLSPLAALVDAAHDDSHLDFASVRFEGVTRSSQAMVWTSDGHPILWVWLSENAGATWSDTVAELAKGFPCVELSIAWDLLVPNRPHLSAELPRAMLHRGESASWTDGEHVLGFNAGLGVVPGEVYLPPESEWPSTAPTWARELRLMIASDFAKLGVLVVDSPGAHVFDNYRRLGIDP